MNLFYLHDVENKKGLSFEKALRFPIIKDFIHNVVQIAENEQIGIGEPEEWWRWIMISDENVLHENVVIKDKKIIQEDYESDMIYSDLFQGRITYDVVELRVEYTYTYSNNEEKEFTSEIYANIIYANGMDFSFGV